MRADSARLVNRLADFCSASARNNGLTFVLAIAGGLLVRLAILGATGSLGTSIIDEQHYAQIASNILAGHGFAWRPGQLTSIRPPLYPALLAGVWALVGDHSLQAVRALQIVLSLATTGLVYLLG